MINNCERTWIIIFSISINFFENAAHVPYVHKIDLIYIYFFSKNLVLRKLCSKWPGIGPKGGFLGIIKNRCIELFDILREATVV